MPTDGAGAVAPGTSTAAPRGRVVVVTGASSGIGRAVALRFAREGARVALAARHARDLEKVAAEVRKAGGDPLVVPTDVTEWGAVQAFAEAVESAWGRADVLVNNAGVGRYGFVKDMDVDDWHEQIATNLTGYFYVAKAFLPLMLGREGVRAIVNVASVSGVDGQPGLSGYCASKFGVRGFSLSLASEVADDGIRVTSVNPGYVATSMAEGADVEESKMIQADDLAEYVRWLVDMPASAFTDDVTVWPRALYTS